MFKGFLDKPEFESYGDEFRAYDHLYRLLFVKKRLLQPFWNFWPKYAKKEFYYEDKNSVDLLLGKK